MAPGWCTHHWHISFWKMSLFSLVSRITHKSILVLCKKDRTSFCLKGLLQLLIFQVKSFTMIQSHWCFPLSTCTIYVVQKNLISVVELNRRPFCGVGFLAWFICFSYSSTTTSTGFLGGHCCDISFPPAWCFSCFLSLQTCPHTDIFFTVQ